MSVPMAIVDFIPVGLFLAAAIILQRDLYNKMSKGAFALFSAGTITVFVAGCFKATWKLIYALGIPNIGLSNAKVICQKFGYDLKKLRSLTREELAEADGIGPVIAGSFVDYFADEDRNRQLDHLLTHLVIQEAPRETNEQIFAGLNFVITGNVEHFANRNAVKAEIEKRGGKVTGSVTSKTNYLINNDVTSNSSKNKKAKELQIPIISENDFIRMLDELTLFP